MADSALSGDVSSRPFFLWAMVQYLRADGLTPLIVVDANYPGVVVPEDFIDVQSGQITLSMGAQATRNLNSSYRMLCFDAAFPGGAVHRLEVPTLSILAVLCQEDATLSMVMGEEERTYGFVDDHSDAFDVSLGGDEAPTHTQQNTPQKKRPSHLRLVTED